MWYTWWKKTRETILWQMNTKRYHFKAIQSTLLFFFFSIKTPTHTQKIIKKHLCKLADVQRNKMNGIMGVFLPQTVTSIF